MFRSRVRYVRNPQSVLPRPKTRGPRTRCERASQLSAGSALLALSAALRYAAPRRAAPSVAEQVSPYSNRIIRGQFLPCSVTWRVRLTPGSFVVPLLSYRVVARHRASDAEASRRASAKISRASLIFLRGARLVLHFTDPVHPFLADSADTPHRQLLSRLLAPTRAYKFFIELLPFRYACLSSFHRTHLGCDARCRFTSRINL